MRETFRVIVRSGTGWVPHPVPSVPMCGFGSPSSEDGYCTCILPAHGRDQPHWCIHGPWR